MTINELKLYCSDVSKQTDFYAKTIGLEIIEQSDVQTVFRIGQSRLKFVERKDFQPYHFAINIPCNQENEALAWLKQRVEILKDGTRDIQDFKSWNARAIYFYDADKNIVELIARKNLNNQSENLFSAHAWLNLSEIGLAVHAIEPIYNQLIDIVKLGIYDGGFERFCAIGDEQGLFICINKQVKDWYPTSDKAYSSEFAIAFTENGAHYSLEFKNGKLEPVS